MSVVLLDFDGRVEGRQVTVSILADRIEWEFRHTVSAWRVVASALTLGVWAVVDGVRQPGPSREVMSIDDLVSASLRVDETGRTALALATRGVWVSIQVPENVGTLAVAVLAELMTDRTKAWRVGDARLGTMTPELSPRELMALAPNVFEARPDEGDAPPNTIDLLITLTELREMGLVSAQTFDTLREEILLRLPSMPSDGRGNADGHVGRTPRSPLGPVTGPESERRSSMPLSGAGPGNASSHRARSGHLGRGSGHDGIDPDSR